MTYRQIACFWERYWARKVWELEVSIKTNPLAGGSDSAGKPDIDMTADDGPAQLAGLGITVKPL